MDYFNDERYWDIKLLNKWFAISSLLFFISIVWMFIDDNDDEYKDYQKKFRNEIEKEVEENKYQKALKLVEISRVEYELRYENVKKEFESESVQDSLHFLENKLIEAEGQHYKVKMEYLYLLLFF